MNDPKRAGAGPATGTPAAAFSSYQKFVVAMLAFLQFTIVLDFMMLAPLGALVMPALHITAVAFRVIHLERISSIVRRRICNTRFFSSSEELSFS